MFYHDRLAIKLRELYNTPTDDNLEEIEYLKSECKNLTLMDRLLRFFPPKPTDQEIASDAREIMIFKKKNDIPVQTAMKIPEVILAHK